MQNTAVSKRWQITLPKNTNLDNRITRLLARYEGMNLSEVVKLALIELDNTSKAGSDTPFYSQEDIERIEKKLDDYYAGKIKTTAVLSSPEEIDDYFNKLNKRV